ncbi:ROK family protein [Williamsia sp. CHRR-6]|uniref:ROK family protein n=1 Tax=Williamsia sp. CHRR-6 TaxID=2835871 RepID=UPI001BDADE6E|nr:ROK family protein [Williamsia sp. CHRR-6]MBT0566000.1 ROK family protein [Williamsia sp. CHRR-6]
MGARQSTLRASNLALAMSAVITATGWCSRARVAETAGITRATAARLVDDLVAAGLLVESDPPPPSGRGRPATPLGPSPWVAALGLQINTASLVGRVIALTGEVIAETVHPGDFRSSDPVVVLARAAALAEQLRADLDPRTRVVGVGLAVPGIVVADTSTVALAANLGWTDVHVPTLLPVGDLALRVGNEADCAAVAVAQTAPGRPGPLQDFLYLSGETGIGGAAVFGGEVFGGRNGFAGEIGHLTVDPHGPSCRCGSTGCLEVYAGHRAVVGAAGADPDTTMREVVSRARCGDERARAALDRAAWALGVALAGAINVLDLPVVVLGGHLADLADELSEQISAHLNPRVLSAHTTPPRVQVDRVDIAGGATGVAYSLLAQVISDPVRWLPVP